MRILLFFMVSFLSLSAQQKRAVDFTQITAEILPILDANEIWGKTTYAFELNQTTDSILIDAVNMEFLYVSLNGQKIEYANSRNQLSFKTPSRIGKHELFLRYVAKPKQTVYFMGSDDEIEGNEQIWTQGQGKYTSHWLPSFDDMTEKIELDLTILVDEAYQVIANGALNGKFVEDGLAEWTFDMKEPMSSYLAAFVIGDFNKKTIQSNSGIPIELYYEPKDSLKVEPTYRHTKQIFDFLEEEIGVAYPWQNYKQVPVQDFLYAGMENTSCTIFSNQYMIDSTAFIDKNYINVNAHELAHQWFGNLVTEVSAEHHWLHEGFATYYAYLAEKELFGEEHFYWKLFETAKTLGDRSERGDGQALIDPKANSLTFYEKGAWALVMLKDEVGEDAFKNGVAAYLKKHQFKNVTIGDFLREIEVASTQDLTKFQERWLNSDTFPQEEAMRYLKSKSSSIELLMDIKKQTTDTTVFDEQKLMWIWGNEMPTFFKRQFLFEYVDQIPDSSIVKIVENEEVKVRQAVAFSIPKVNTTLKPAFESMLLDESYITQETVLFKLWEAFPENRVTYLESTKGVTGLPNKNLRLLWLTLALITPEYQANRKKVFYEELNGYTATHYNFEVRQLAFQYLYQIQALNDASLVNLIKASEHHVWQFKKSSRNLLRNLYGTESEKTRLDGIKTLLSDEQKRIFDTVVHSN